MRRQQEERRENKGGTGGKTRWECGRRGDRRKGGKCQQGSRNTREWRPVPEKKLAGCWCDDATGERKQDDEGLRESGRSQLYVIVQDRDEEEEEEEWATWWAMKTDRWDDRACKSPVISNVIPWLVMPFSKGNNVSDKIQGIPSRRPWGIKKQELDQGTSRQATRRGRNEQPSQSHWQSCHRLFLTFWLLKLFYPQSFIPE